MSNFTPEQIAEYNRKIAVQIEGWEKVTRFEVENCWSIPMADGTFDWLFEHDGPPSYHSDHAALHRVIEKIGPKLSILPNFRDVIRDIHDEFTGPDRIMEAIYSAVCHYLDQIGGEG